MQTAVIFCLILVLSSAQFAFQLSIPPPFPPFDPSGFPVDETYAASLEEAPVGLYGKKNLGGFGPYFGKSEVSGASLGGARVGFYGKEHPQKSAVPIPSPVPVVGPAIVPVHPVVPYIKPVVPYGRPVLPYRIPVMTYGRPPYGRSTYIRPKI